MQNLNPARCTIGGFIMKRVFKTLKFLVGITACVLMCVFYGGEEMTLLRRLPDTIYTDGGSPEEAANVIGDTLGSVGAAVQDDVMTVRMFGLPVKTVNIRERQEITVMPGGNALAISIEADGVLVVGLGDVNGSSPAYEAGIRAGDIITAVNGKKPKNSDELTRMFAECGEETVTITVKRKGRILKYDVTPAMDANDGRYRLGIWARDDTAGIGTLTFVADGRFCALGHSIADVDTGVTIEVDSGDIAFVDIISISRSQKGSAGELIGRLLKDRDRCGAIEKNNDYGIYGTMEGEFLNDIYDDGVLLAYPEEAHVGKATLLATVEGGEVRAYECSIIKVFPQSEKDVKSMVVEVTDDALLDLAGGIVQGMSGSPIIQDGKLIGAVTHVFVNDPTKGYCLYAWWMYDEMNG